MPEYENLRDETIYEQLGKVKWGVGSHGGVSSLLMVFVHCC